MKINFKLFLIIVLILISISLFAQDNNNKTHKDPSINDKIYERDLNNYDTYKIKKQKIKKKTKSNFLDKKINKSFYYTELSNRIKKRDFKFSYIKKPTVCDENINLLYLFLGIPYYKVKNKLHPIVRNKIENNYNKYNNIEKAVKEYFKNITYKEIVIPIMLLSENIKTIFGKYDKNKFWHFFFNSELTNSLFNVYNKDKVTQSFISNLYIGLYNLDPRVRLICLNILNSLPYEIALKNYLDITLTFETVGDSDVIVQRLKYSDMFCYYLGYDYKTKKHGNVFTGAKYKKTLKLTQKYLKKFKGKEYIFLDTDGVYKLANPYKLLYRLKLKLDRLEIIAELENISNAKYFSFDKIKKEDFYLILYSFKELESNFWDRIMMSNKVIINEDLKSLKLEDLTKLEVGDTFELKNTKGKDKNLNEDKDKDKNKDKLKKLYRSTKLTCTTYKKLYDYIIPLNIYFDGLSSYSYFINNQKKDLSRYKKLLLINKISKGLNNRNMFINQTCRRILRKFYNIFNDNIDIRNLIIDILTKKYKSNS